MKLSSLFKGKVYTIPQTQNQDEDRNFALEVLKRIKPKLQVSEIIVGAIKNNYDVFVLKDNIGKIYKLKISLDDSESICSLDSIQDLENNLTTPEYYDYSFFNSSDEDNDSDNEYDNDSDNEYDNDSDNDSDNESNNESIYRQKLIIYLNILRSLLKIIYNNNLQSKFSRIINKNGKHINYIIQDI